MSQNGEDTAEEEQDDLQQKKSVVQLVCAVTAIEETGKGLAKSHGNFLCAEEFSV